MSDHSQIYLPKMTFINKLIIIISSSLFILNFALNKTMGMDLTSILGLSGEHVSHLHLYSLLTYPFMTTSLIELILNSLMLWLMGSEFEENWGRSRYLSFLGAVIFGGGLFYLALSFIFFRNHLLFAYPLVGMSGLVASLCVAYAVIYPTRIFSFMMIIPVQAKYFCWILVIIALYQGISSPLMVGAWGQLGAILAGFLFMVLVSNRNFKLLSQKMSSLTQMSNRKKSKAKLSIVRDDNEKPPKYWQ